MSTNIFPPNKEIADDKTPYSGERMTEVQAVELRDLADKTGEPFDGQLTQRQADMRIRELRKKLEN